VVEVGQEAPDFTLRDAENQEVTLSSFRGRRNVVLVFYPLAFSPTCTRQLSAIGGREAEYAGSDAQVIGVSVDSRWAQRAFAESLGLSDTILLADFEPKGAVARAYGVYQDDRGFSARATFVIDSAGIVRSAVTVGGSDIPDEDEYFATLATCQID
jgi:mycoredoxin-dependent peroxiredoxin